MTATDEEYQEAVRTVVILLKLLQEVLQNEDAVNAMSVEWLRKVTEQMGAGSDG